MTDYYCPYCNPKYQFQKRSTNGSLICGLCGDPLLKKPLIKIMNGNIKGIINEKEATIPII